MQSRITGNTLIVAGPRNFFDREVIIDNLINAICKVKPTKIITGNATGVDQITAEYCHGLTEIEFEVFPANWDKYGRSAGPRRNYFMAMQATHLIAFTNGSPGTSNMIYFAKRHDLEIILVNI
ncbi:MAG: SLOG family protein [Patescibacteria group bacterium]|jgi:hypothetical protein